VRCLYLVHDGTRFEDERDEPLSEGELFSQLDVTYRVDRVLPGRDDFDVVYEVTHVGGPTEVGGD
jgi:hypothetical protein